MKKGDVLQLEYTGSEQVLKFNPGKYQFECWGASGNGKEINGNTANSGACGKGGYSKGIFTTFSNITLYAYVGGVGEYSATGLAKGGWNGGGCAWATDLTEPANGGGGASDIRLIGGAWDDPQGLLSRIIVAGGGAGGGEDSGDNGGSGGGLVGLGSNAGTQDSSRGGAVFGKGSHTNCDGGGGGGGWFGGGSTNGSQTIPTFNNTGDTGSTQSGGSGYVLDSNTYKPTGYLGKPEHYLFDSLLINGVSAMPNPNGTGTIVGNLSNGYIRVTCLDTIETSNSGSAVFVKVNGEWKKSINSLVKVNGVWK